MRNLIPIVPFVLFYACTQNTQTDSEASIEEEQPAISQSREPEVSKEQIDNELDPEIALDFINGYIGYINSADNYDIIIWAESSELVTDTFRSELKEMITKAFEEEPEYGLGFDPILDAQDYPDEGFELSNFDETTGIATVKDKSSDYFDLNIKLIHVNGETLVDGAGVVNVPEKYRVER